ncbi:MAG: hypothetical protein AMJ43_05140 [Coxiella sp. DG_40]|nr:MAG: hypothetical protein AMJ43_05140 [Coxiella sp. DG_40]
MNTVIKYGGFWVRFTASVVDSLLVLVVILPLLVAIYGPKYFVTNSLIKGPADFIICWIFPLLAILAFWKYKSATPGKMLFKFIITDATTLQKPSTGQLIIRYLGYCISTIPFCLGFLWIAIDRRKQGWHDKIARTVVIKKT